MAVIRIHIGFCDITDRDHALQIIVRRSNRQCDHVVVFHHGIRFLHGNRARYARHLMDFNFLYLRSRIRQIPRCAHAKALQYILGLLIDLTGTPRHVGFGFICPVLDIRIGNRRTNGIRIRIFMANYINS